MPPDLLEVCGVSASKDTGFYSVSVRNRSGKKSIKVMKRALGEDDTGFLIRFASIVLDAARELY